MQVRDDVTDHGVMQGQYRLRHLSTPLPSLASQVTIRGTGKLAVTNSVQPVVSQRSCDTEWLHIYHGTRWLIA